MILLPTYTYLAGIDGIDKYNGFEKNLVETSLEDIGLFIHTGIHFEPDIIPSDIGYYPFESDPMINKIFAFGSDEQDFTGEIVTILSYQTKRTSECMDLLKVINFI